WVRRRELEQREIEQEHDIAHQQQQGEIAAGRQGETHPTFPPDQDGRNEGHHAVPGVSPQVDPPAMSRVREDVPRPIGDPFFLSRVTNPWPLFVSGRPPSGNRAISSPDSSVGKIGRRNISSLPHRIVYSVPIP